MVLQSGSVRTIWGFLDGVRESVTLTGSCELNGMSFDIVDEFVPNKPVSFLDLFVNAKFSEISNLQEMDYEFWFYTDIEEGSRCNFRITQETNNKVSTIASLMI